MSIYTIGDLHLSFREDLVVLPGDFSWATYLKDTDLDFEYINNLPGKKLLLKGNHDYWWTTLNKLRTFVEEEKFSNIDFIYNNAYEFENKIIVGTRGWSFGESEEDKKIAKREAMRLELSINEGKKLYGEEKEVIAFMHYPPIINSHIAKNEPSDYVRVMQKYGIKKCFYGHLHSTSIQEAVDGNYFGIEFKLVSADGVDFKLVKIN